jgi:hypothetical protein
LALGFCQPPEDPIETGHGLVHRCIEFKPNRRSALLAGRVCGFRTLAYLGCFGSESRVQKVIRGATGYADDSQELTPLPLGSIQAFVREENLATFMAVEKQPPLGA